MILEKESRLGYYLLFPSSQLHCSTLQSKPERDLDSFIHFYLLFAKETQLFTIEISGQKGLVSWCRENCRFYK